VNGAVVVTTKEGLLRVEGSGPAVEVAKGKTITVHAKAARAPQGAGSGAAGISGSTGMQLAAVATGVTSSVLGATAIVRAGDARDAATAADSAAEGAQAAAEDATAAAEAAQAEANSVGCALDQVGVQIDPNLSPYQAGGGTCD
jgi:hypothetical protein